MRRARSGWSRLAILQLAVCLSARVSGAQQVSPVGPRPAPMPVLIRVAPRAEALGAALAVRPRADDPASDRAGLRRATLTGAVVGAVLGLVVVGIPCHGIASCGEADAPLPLIAGALGAAGGALIGAYAWTVPRARRPAALSGNPRPP